MLSFSSFENRGEMQNLIRGQSDHIGSPNYVSNSTHKFEHIVQSHCSKCLFVVHFQLQALPYTNQI